MSDVVFPEGFRLELLRRGHPRRGFDCGEEPERETAGDDDGGVIVGRVRRSGEPF
jgi:hypothetical protein